MELNPSMGKIPQKRRWQPASVFLPGESQGQRSLAGYRPRSHKELRHFVSEHTHTGLWATKPSYHKLQSLCTTPSAAGRFQTLKLRLDAAKSKERKIISKYKNKISAKFKLVAAQRGTNKNRKLRNKGVLKLLFLFQADSLPAELRTSQSVQLLSSVHSVQSLSCVRLYNPMNPSMPGFPFHHQIPEFTQTHVHQVHDAIQPYHPLSWPSPPAFSVSQHQFRSVQLLIRVQLQASLSITNSQTLFKLLSIASVMPSNHLILCHPLLLPPSIFPTSGSFPMSWFFASGGQSTGVYALASVLPRIFRTDFL